MTVQQQLRPVTVTGTPAAAIVGLVLAFLFWPAGLLVSKKALRKSRLRGERGAGLAFAGVAVSVLVGLATVGLFVASAVGAMRSGPVLTGGQLAACLLDVEHANRALAVYESSGELPLRGEASARLSALHDAGYLTHVPGIPALGLDERGRFTSAC